MDEYSDEREVKWGEIALHYKVNNRGEHEGELSAIWCDIQGHVKWWKSMGDVQDRTKWRESREQRLWSLRKRCSCEARCWTSRSSQTSEQNGMWRYVCEGGRDMGKGSFETIVTEKYIASEY